MMSRRRILKVIALLSVASIVIAWVLYNLIKMLYGNKIETKNAPETGNQATEKNAEESSRR